LNGLGKWRWIVPGALVITLALSGSTLAAPVGQITEFPTATTSSFPVGMAPGPDGNLWFAEDSLEGRIAEVNPTTGVVSGFATPTEPSLPLGIGLGSDGNMWFTESANPGKVGEINPSTHAITEIPTPTTNSAPVAIVAGPDGNVWFTESAVNKVAEINPSTHVITEFTVTTANSQPFGIAAGPDGNIWFTEKAVNQIGEINPSTHVINEFPVPTGSSQPNAIAPGPNGTLWFTEQAGNKVTAFAPSSPTTMTETATPVNGPLVIVPGADGNMWFTEGATPGAVASINPVTRAITSFPTPTTNANPIGAAPGSDGNVWFGENAAAKVGRVGVGAPAAVVSAPAVTGTAQVGQTLTCQAASFSAWAGQLPTFEFGFDGFRWLLDGGLIAGATGQTLAVPAADAAHQVSCEEIATYPLLTTTVPTTSAPVTISPSLGASLISTSTTPTTVSLTIACQGLPTQTCSGKATLTSHVTTQGSKIVAVAAKSKPKPKPKPPKKVTKMETIASGSYSVAAGRTATVKLSLNSTGKKLLTARYKVPATLTVTGTASAKKTVTFKYGVISISPAYTWAFSKTFSYAIELSLSRLPKGSKVTLSCHGHGCPFSKKTFSTPKSGKLALASALKKRHLTPGGTVQIQITASDEVGEVVVFTILPGKSPRESFLCLPPGAHRPSACAR
jgi:streptogramin lyase